MRRWQGVPDSFLSCSLQFRSYLTRGLGKEEYYSYFYIKCVVDIDLKGLTEAFWAQLFKANDVVS